MKKLFVLLFAFAAACVAVSAPQKSAPQAKAAYERALALDKESKRAEALMAFFEAIEAAPDDFALHDALEKFRLRWVHKAHGENPISLDGRPSTLDKALKAEADAMGKTIEAKYGDWDRRFPDSVAVWYVVGARLTAKEDPRARDYLLKVIARRPDLAKVYPMLASDAERRGDRAASAQYMRKASELEPDNPDYAVGYANKLREVAPGKWEAAVLDVVRRFPDSGQSAQALFLLGQGMPDDTRRIAVWEKLRTQFPPEKSYANPVDKMVASRAFAMATSQLSEIYLRIDPPRAVKLAEEAERMAQGDPRQAKTLAERTALARAYMEVREQIAAGKAAEAVGLLDKLTPERNSSNAAMLLRLKAEALAAAGKVREAYDSLIKPQASAPDNEIRTALERLGAQLDKTPQQVGEDVAAVRDAAASTAPPFDLQMYTSNDTVSLAGLRGKVVFVTFWFPGCGPCRAEFPYFENVVRRFRGKDLVYLGINGYPDQDAYVLPFMKNTGYSFIPLRAMEAVIKGPDSYNVRGYPTNFLIDRSGRIVYRNFRAGDAYSEQVLARMIESLL